MTVAFSPPSDKRFCPSLALSCVLEADFFSEIIDISKADMLALTEVCAEKKYGKVIYIAGCIDPRDYMSKL